MAVTSDMLLLQCTEDSEVYVPIGGCVVLVEGQMRVEVVDPDTEGSIRPEFV